MKNILLVEDDALIAETLIFALEQEAFTVQWKSKGSDAIRHFDEQGADLILLDIGLPDMNGFDVLRAIRERSQVPVIFTTARDEEIDKVLGLELGADDYVTKPLSPRELVARVKANLKRVNPEQTATPIPATPLESKNSQSSVFSIDLRQMQITLHDTVLSLTAAEFKLLQYFIDSPRQVFSREQIISAVWDNSYVVDTRTIDTHIKSLRAKLRDAEAGNADYIKTHRGLGYSLDI